MCGRPKKDTVFSWIYLGVVMFTVQLLTGIVESFGILLAVFVEYFGESKSEAGWVGSITFLMGCFAFPVAVYLRRHFGFRLVVLCAAVLVAFAFISTPFMPKLHFLYLTYSIPFGIGAGFIDCFSVITLREFFAKYLSIALGMRFAASSIGQIVWSYLLPVLLDAVGWRKTFMAFSSFSIACIFYAMVYRRPTVHQTGEKISAKDHDIADAAAIPRKRGASYGFLRNTAFLFLLVACLMVALVIAVPAMFIVQYAKSLGHPLLKSKWLLFVRGLTSLVTRIVIGCIGHLALRCQRVASTVRVVVILFGVSTALCSLTQHLLLMMLYMGFVGCLEGMYWFFLPLLSMEISREDNTDEAYACLIFASGLGYLVGAPSMGWLYDVTGDFHNVLYAVSTCSLIASVLMSLAMCMRSPRDYSTEHDKTVKTDSYLQTAEINCLNMFELSSAAVLPDLLRFTKVQYETAV